jgi:hypothetical protein
MEQQQLRIPCEQARRFFRLRQKRTEKVLRSLADQSQQSLDRAGALEQLRSLRAEVSGLWDSEVRALELLQTRYRGLMGAATAPATAPGTNGHVFSIASGVSATVPASRDGSLDLDLLIADYLLKTALPDAPPHTAESDDAHATQAATALPSLAGSGDLRRMSGVRHFIERALSPSQRAQLDVEEIGEIGRIAHLVRTTHRSALPEAIAWAERNASRLRRRGSFLDFFLKRQEFLCLLQEGRHADALQYVTAVLSPAALVIAESAASIAAGEEGTAAGGATASLTSPRRLRIPSVLPASTTPPQLPAGTAAPASAPTAVSGTLSPPPLPSQPPPPTATSHPILSMLQVAVSLMAFPNPATCGVPEAAVLYGPRMWSDLGLEFRSAAWDAMGVFGPPYSPLELILRAGLASVKTPACEAHLSALQSKTDAADAEAAAADWDAEAEAEASSDACSADDPLLSRLLRLRLDVDDEEGAAASDTEQTERAADVPADDAHESGSESCLACHPFFRPLAQALPLLPRDLSFIRDALTREVLDESNPSYLLPDGGVYGRRTLELLCLEPSAVDKAADATAERRQAVIIRPTLGADKEDGREGKEKEEEHPVDSGLWDASRAKRIYFV